jgi:hypothetical protein
MLTKVWLGNLRDHAGDTKMRRRIIAKLVLKEMTCEGIDKSRVVSGSFF